MKTGHKVFIALAIAGLLLAPGLVLSQSATNAPPHVPLQKTIAASGHVVCPGFIDMHHTGPSIVFVNGRSHSGLRRDGR